jgi:hypothetical protein
MFAPSRDVIPKDLPRPECCETVMDIIDLPTECVMKRDRNEHSSNIPDFYLNADELQEYQSKFRNSSDTPRTDLTLNRYVYRNIIPLPVVSLARCARSLDFAHLTSELEDLIAKEEDQSMVI